jgi:phage I-like protein
VVYVTSRVIVAVVPTMYSVLSNKATASSSRAEVDGSVLNSGRVVSKYSEYLSQLVKKRVIVSVCLLVANWRITGMQSEESSWSVIVPC